MFYSEVLWLEICNPKFMHILLTPIWTGFTINWIFFLKFTSATILQVQLLAFMRNRANMIKQNVWGSCYLSHLKKEYPFRILFPSLPLGLVLLFLLFFNYRLISFYSKFPLMFVLWWWVLFLYNTYYWLYFFRYGWWVDRYVHWLASFLFLVGWIKKKRVCFFSMQCIWRLCWRWFWQVAKMLQTSQMSQKVLSTQEFYDTYWQIIVYHKNVYICINSCMFLVPTSHHPIIKILLLMNNTQWWQDQQQHCQWCYVLH